MTSPRIIVTPDDRTPLTKGMDAFEAGDDLDDNPYHTESREAAEWERGYRAAERTEGGRTMACGPQKFRPLSHR
ncbi:MAG: hypothetical protein EOP82_21625 [Variovorax sp.]|nr:MAG: hypothetical protein EOP82_21625 [Variovorax sp.]